jgi:hypothetical protein
MSKRSFLCATLALLAGLAWATPSRAAGTIITTTISFQADSPGLTEIDLTYSTGGGTLSAETPGTLSGGAGTAALVGNVVQLKFSPADTGPFGPFTFSMLDSATTAVTATPTFTPANTSLTSFSFNIQQVLQSSVSEPSTMALLGIGMTGFLAFRRFFKKTSVA